MKRSKSGLTELQRAFVEYYVVNGGNASRAARDAGYCPGNPKAAKVEGHYLLKKPHVIHAILEETVTTFALHVPKALKTLIDLAAGAESESVRLQAAQALLDRGGLQLAQRHEVIVRDERTDAEIVASIRALSQELGLTPAPANRLAHSTSEDPH